MLASHPAIYAGPETRFFALVGGLEKKAKRLIRKGFSVPVYTTKDFTKVTLRVILVSNISIKLSTGNPNTFWKNTLLLFSGYSHFLRHVLFI